MGSAVVCFHIRCCCGFILCFLLSCTNQPFFIGTAGSTFRSLKDVVIFSEFSKESAASTQGVRLAGGEPSGLSSYSYRKREALKTSFLEFVVFFDRFTATLEVRWFCLSFYSILKGKQ